MDVRNVWLVAQVDTFGHGRREVLGTAPVGHRADGFDVCHEFARWIHNVDVNHPSWDGYTVGNIRLLGVKERSDLQYEFQVEMKAESGGVYLVRYLVEKTPAFNFQLEETA